MSRANYDNNDDQDRFGHRCAGAGWGWIDSVGVDATDIAKQQAADEGEAMQDAAKFARRVRRRLGLRQAELSRHIDVSIDTIRNGEQGKRCPTGAAKALLKVLDRAPETSMAALYWK